jgi:hypothetical protein
LSSESYPRYSRRAITVGWGNGIQNQRQTRTAIHRIYTYDGVDVDDPERTLWPTLLAANDPDVERLRWEFNDIVQRRQTAHVAGTLLTMAGLTMAVIGGVQNERWNEQRNAWQSTWQTVYETRPNYVTRTCNSWMGSTSNGVTNWTCSSDRSLTFTGASPPFSLQVQQGTIQVPVTSPALTQAPVTSPNGRGLIIGGIAAMLIGSIVFVSPRGNRHDTFHRAVQTYNRALERRISWEFQPFAPSTLAGVGLVGKF